ncbi:hypothetical protein AOLI_G00200470 [Acnodon oligacanthus]
MYSPIQSPLHVDTTSVKPASQNAGTAVNTVTVHYVKKISQRDQTSKINVAFREVVDRVKKKSYLDKTELLCDCCMEVKLKAEKACLDCGVTFCKSHLQPHNSVPRLKKRRLIDPVESLENYICQNYERPLELFSRDDQMCVCLSCTVTNHKTHKTVPIEEESGERKKNTEKATAESGEVFSALIRSIERSQAELLEVMEEQQKAAEREAEGLINMLEQELTELKRRDTQLEQLSHSKDHLHLLQIYPSLCTPLRTNNWTDISIATHLSVETVRKALSELQKTLDEKLCELEPKRIQQYAVDVTLDPDTAHPELIVSDDGKQVACGAIKQTLPDKPERFDYSHSVLGKDAFSSGKFYYQVNVKEKTTWPLGVVRQSIVRKGPITLSPENGFWSVIRADNELVACADAPFSVPPREDIQKVGVFVDYEEGLVSFSETEARSHIYTFSGQAFSEKWHPYFYTSLKDGVPLIISPTSK